RCARSRCPPATAGRSATGWRSSKPGSAWRHSSPRPDQGRASGAGPEPGLTTPAAPGHHAGSRAPAARAVETHGGRDAERAGRHGTTDAVAVAGAVPGHAGDRGPAAVLPVLGRHHRDRIGTPAGAFAPDR